MQLTRVFNADVGDESTGNAGPDALEQDLDNLYENKVWKEDVLSKDNTIEYIPAQNYHPATKKYVDDKTSETLQTVNQSISALDNDIDLLSIYKADKSNVLEKDNDMLYVPTANYHPATKKYVDDEATTLNDAIVALDDKFTSHFITGTYTGDGTIDLTKSIPLTFQPSMVIIQDSTSPITYSIIRGYDCKDSATPIGRITLTGFLVAHSTNSLNATETTYNYIAFK